MMRSYMSINFETSGGNKGAMDLIVLCSYYDTKEKDINVYILSVLPIPDEDYPNTFIVTIKIEGDMDDAKKMVEWIQNKSPDNIIERYNIKAYEDETQDFINRMKEREDE